MGGIQSVNYPSDYPQKLSPNNLPEITATNENRGGTTGSVTIVSRGDIKLVEKHFENQLQMLDSYLNLYQLFDGYDSKNSIVIKDLEKKLLNQKKELKLLYETKDKLHSNLDYSKTKFNKYQNTQRNLNILIIILAISLPIIIFFILNEFRNYLEYQNNLADNLNNASNN